MRCKKSLNPNAGFFNSITERPVLCGVNLSGLSFLYTMQHQRKGFVDTRKHTVLPTKRERKTV